MKVVMNGFNEFSDTLGIDLPKSASWQNLADMLSIAGVRYYILESCWVGVRYSKAVDARDVAAQSLHVIAHCFNTSVSEMAVEVLDCMVGGKENRLGLADEIE